MTWSVKPIQWPSFIILEPWEISTNWIEGQNTKGLPKKTLESGCKVETTSFLYVFLLFMRPFWMHMMPKNELFFMPSVMYRQLLHSAGIVKLWKNSRKSINTNLLHKSRSTFTWPKNNLKVRNSAFDVDPVNYSIV